MDKYDRKTLGGRLSDLLDDTRAKYARLQERDRMEQARRGAESIKVNGFGIAEHEHEARSLVVGAGERAVDNVDAAIKRERGKLVEPPSDGAVNYIASIVDREDLTSDEIDAALERYTDHASQKAIRAAAHRSGLRQYGSTSEVEQALHALAQLRADVAKTYSVHTFGSMTDGAVKMTKAMYGSFGEDGTMDALDALFSLGDSSRG